jgi:hypothetical protein
MSTSYTFSNTQTFTVTHAKQLASKVATDLKRLNRFYNEPSDDRIADFEQELIEFLKDGYLEEVYYGFKRNGKWIPPTLHYTARDIILYHGQDDDPGKIRPNENISGASFYSFMIYNTKYSELTSQEQDDFKKRLPFNRTTADKPDHEGYFSNDLMYYAGGRSLNRKTLNK